MIKVLKFIGKVYLVLVLFAFLHMNAKAVNLDSASDNMICGDFTLTPQNNSLVFGFLQLDSPVFWTGSTPLSDIYHFDESGNQIFSLTNKQFQRTTPISGDNSWASPEFTSDNNWYLIGSQFGRNWSYFNEYVPTTLTTCFHTDGAFDANPSVTDFQVIFNDQTVNGFSFSDHSVWDIVSADIIYNWDGVGSPVAPSGNSGGGDGDSGGTNIDIDLLDTNWWGYYRSFPYSGDVSYDSDTSTYTFTDVLRGDNVNFSSFKDDDLDFDGVFPTSGCYSHVDIPVTSDAPAISSISARPLFVENYGDAADDGYEVTMPILEIHTQYLSPSLASHYNYQESYFSDRSWIYGDVDTYTDSIDGLQWYGSLVHDLTFQDISQVNGPPLTPSYDYSTHWRTSSIAHSSLYSDFHYLRVSYYDEYCDNTGETVSQFEFVITGDLGDANIPLFSTDDIPTLDGYDPSEGLPVTVPSDDFSLITDSVSQVFSCSELLPDIDAANTQIANNASEQYDFTVSGVTDFISEQVIPTITGAAGPAIFGGASYVTCEVAKNAMVGFMGVFHVLDDTILENAGLAPIFDAPIAPTGTSYCLVRNLPDDADDWWNFLGSFCVEMEWGKYSIDRAWQYSILAVGYAVAFDYLFFYRLLGWSGVCNWGRRSRNFSNKKSK